MPLGTRVRIIHVATPNDALLLFEATTRDDPILQNITQRPAYRERDRLIKPGHILVYNERSSGIRRWTDGIHWTPSRVSGRFLIYHQLSSTAAIERGSSNQDGEWGEREPNGCEDHSLIKKTFSAERDGTVHHLLSYYTTEYVKMNRLRTPSCDPTLAILVIAKDWKVRNFRRNVPSQDSSKKILSRRRGHSSNSNKDGRSWLVGYKMLVSPTPQDLYSDSENFPILAQPYDGRFFPLQISSLPLFGSVYSGNQQCIATKSNITVQDLGVPGDRQQYNTYLN